MMFNKRFATLESSVSEGLSRAKRIERKEVSPRHREFARHARQPGLGRISGVARSALACHMSMASFAEASGMRQRRLPIGHRRN
jgi:hypothetical protein